jgi:hypothetical protein
LTGFVFGQRVNTAGANPIVTGSAYFVRGDWIKALGRNVAREIVTLKDGTENSGHVVGVSTDTTVEMVLSDGMRKTIRLADISTRVSPRAFSFEIPSRSLHIQPTDNSYGADAINIRFNPAMLHSGMSLLTHKPQVPLSTLPGTEGGISDKALTFMVVNDIAAGTIANAIAIPLVFSASTLHTRQLLYAAENAAAGQSKYAPQVYANGTIHYYPTH